MKHALHVLSLVSGPAYMLGNAKCRAPPHAVAFPVTNDVLRCSLAGIAALAYAEKLVHRTIATSVA